MRLDNVADVYALAPMQEGMLFHSVSEEGSGVFVTQVSAVLATAPHAETDLTTFKRSWDRLVERHESLRTAFLWDGLDEPLQVVRERVELPWVEEDWRDVDEATRGARWAQLLSLDRARGFDLSEAPLARMLLVRTGEREWRWAWSFHHLIVDGWSTRLLLRELSELCAGGLGEPAGLRAAPRYRDYIAWHAGRDAAAAEDFWRRELRGFAEPTGLDFVRPPRPDGIARARQVSRRLSVEATSALRSMAASRRLTLSTVLQGAWALLLARYSGAEDVVFGVTTSGRPPDLPGIENAVGLFINTLPLRVAVEPQAPLDGWLRALQSRQVALRRWESSALQSVQRWSEVPAGRPLFESILVFENQPPMETAAGDPGYELRALEFAEQSNYPLALLAIPGERLELLLVHDEARVSSPDADRVAGQLEVLLNSFRRRPEAALDELSMISPAERQEVLVEWNRTAREMPPRGVVYLFEEMARGLGDSPAVTCGTQTVSYRELDRRVERLGNHLRALGVGAEVRVGLLVERSVEMITGILGVLAAGGAYVPLDPSHPAGYRRAVLDEARPRVVLTRRELLDQLPSQGVVTVLLDEPETWDVPAGAAAEPAPRTGVAERDTLAYVIYTSGSAGRPKGVEVTQGNLVSSTLARFALYPGAADRFLLLSSFAFDSSVAGIFWTLLSGGHLVLPAPGAERDLDAVRTLIREHRVTHTLCLPALYEVLLAEAPAGELESLRFVIVAGEACPASVAAAHHAALPGARLFNEYGPTECAVWCSAHEVLPADAAGPVPIGRPVANTRLFVLDGRRRPVAVGVVGELYVAGEGVARGYLGDGVLTAERFVTLQIDGVPEQRAYRTGDLARYRSDGSLLFVGRSDSQVKVRGYRVETAELEAALRRHPWVTDAAVGARRLGGAASSTLVAWVVARPNAAVDVPALAAWLRARLPAVMIPDRFLILDRLPRTPTGKVDHRALEAPEPGRDGAFVKPSGEVERAFAAVWSELLGVERVGARDNFYELGGDSILGIQVVSRLRQAGYAVEPRHVSACPTIAELAAAAGRARGVGEGEPEEAPLEGEVALLPIQAWFLARELASPHHWNQSRLFEVEGDLDPERLRAALQHCLDHHDMLRARFERDGEGGWRQVVATPGDVPAALVVVDLATIPASERRAARSRRVAEAQASLDLEGGRLFRAVWFPPVPGVGESSTGLLLLVAHHLIIDAASWAPLVADLWLAYERLAAGESPTLPARTAGYGRWAQRVVETVAAAAASELVYWTSVSEGAGVPRDSEPERPPTEADARTVRVALDRRRSEALLREVHEAYGTRVEDLLVAALGRALCRWSGRPTLRLGMEGHGRPEDLDTSRTVGWFTVAYPVDLSIRSEDGPGGCLKSVKEQLRAVPRRGLGHGVLRYSNVDREAARRLAARAEPEVLFNYLSRVDASAAVGPLRPVEGAEATSRDPRNARSHLLEINASVRDGELAADWIYCGNVHRRESVTQVAATFVSELEALVDHCLHEEAGGFTASDFPAADLEEDDLEVLLGRLEPGER